MSGSFIRRAAPAVLLTGAAVGVVGLLDPALGSVGTSPVASQASVTADSGSTSSGGTSSGGTSSGGTDSGATSSGSGSGSGSSSSGSTDSGSSSTSASCANATEVAGDAESTPYGPVQVAALVADGQVCSVYAVTYPTNDHRSQEINAYAIPVLDAAATADGVSFQGVSGATYTSEGYRASLQSILDQL